MSLVNWRAVSVHWMCQCKTGCKTAMLPSQSIKVGEESLGMHFGQCALYTRAGAREGRPCWVSTRNALHWTHRCVPPLLNPWRGFATLGSRQGMKSHRSWREGTLLWEGRQAQFPDALILLGSNSAHAYGGSPCAAACLSCSSPLKGRAAAPAPHPDWSRAAGRPWHCHPEPLCKYQNYFKAPPWSLQNLQLKKKYFEILLVLVVEDKTKLGPY